MISPFGVDHGYESVEKGLPSALRGAQMSTRTNTQAIRINNRIAANKYGKEAAKDLSHIKNPKAAMERAEPGSWEMRARHTINSGKNQKGFFKQGLSGPGGRRLNKPNGFGLE